MRNSQSGLFLVEVGVGVEREREEGEKNDDAHCTLCKNVIVDYRLLYR